MAVIPWPLSHVSKPPASSARAPVAEDVAGMAAALIQSRQTILPKRLGAPGPNAAELAQILQAAAHAPDHGQLVPWRFVLVPDASRPRLAGVFAQALLERDPAALDQFTGLVANASDPANPANFYSFGTVGTGVAFRNSRRIREVYIGPRNLG
eukprot:gene10631-14270_t